MHKERETVVMNISEKIMIFAGSDSAKELTEALSEQIDDMYVVSDDYYGKRQTIVGNITMLSRQMDEEDIKKWVERVGIKILIDGTQVQCKKASEQLRLAAEQNGLEYYKIQDKMEIDYSRAVKCKTADDIATLASNNVGRILMIGCESIVEEIVKVKDERLKNRVIAVLPPTEENIKRCKLSGYPDNLHLFIFSSVGGKTAITLFFSLSSFTFTISSTMLSQPIIKILPTLFDAKVAISSAVLHFTALE